jgi:hypothetical protein
MEGNSHRAAFAAVPAGELNWNWVVMASDPLLKLPEYRDPEVSSTL